MNTLEQLLSSLLGTSSFGKKGDFKLDKLPPKEPRLIESKNPFKDLERPDPYELMAELRARGIEREAAFQKLLAGIGRKQSFELKIEGGRYPVY